VLAGLLGGLAVVTFLGALLFGCAGRFDLPMFWAYLGVWTASVLVSIWLVDPTLITERMRPGPGAKDYGLTLAFLPLSVGQFIVAGLDVGRFHWSDSVPPVVQAIGLLAVGAALAVFVWASVVNRFFSSVIRIQTERGHRVITSGPYRVVRHPAYAVAPLLFVGTGLALGSWLAALAGLPLELFVLRRTIHEDRVLRQELEGYAAYAQRVRYRLIPGVW
jgi:protein-S-isoprenylcysteine O-methyltransferase Ste14